MSEKQVILLEYANPSKLPRSFSEKKARIVKWLSAIPIVIGLLILVAFASTGFAIFVDLGLLWLLAGGTLTSLMLIVSGGVYSSIRGDDSDSAPARKQCLYAVLICLLSLPVAMFCLIAGRLLVDWWVVHVE